MWEAWYLRLPRLLAIFDNVFPKFQTGWFPNGDGISLSICIILSVIFSPLVQHLLFFCNAFFLAVLGSSSFPLFHTSQAFDELVCPLAVTLPQIFFSLTTQFSYPGFLCIFLALLEVVVHLPVVLISVRFEYFLPEWIVRIPLWSVQPQDQWRSISAELSPDRHRGRPPHPAQRSGGCSTVTEERAVSWSWHHPSRTGPSRRRGRNYRYHDNLRQDLADRKMANPVEPVLGYHTFQKRQPAVMPELSNSQPHQPHKQCHAEDHIEQTEAASRDHR